MVLHAKKLQMMHDLSLDETVQLFELDLVRFHVEIARLVEHEPLVSVVVEISHQKQPVNDQ